MTLTVQRRFVTGEVDGTVELDGTVFGVEANVALLHQVVTAQLAAARAGTQSTKTRAEVSGGGKKPFKQKGTGRARQGSERAPHFAGGGVALGPKPRSYRQRTPRKMVRLALRCALSDRAAQGRVAVVDRWPWETPSTKDARSALASLGLDGKILVVLTRADEAAYRSFRNLPEVQVILDGELNAYDVLCNDWIVFTAATLPAPADTSVAVASPTLASPTPATSTLANPTPASPAAETSPEQEPATSHDISQDAEEAGDE
jgi:large subunit ribosomal protein L4